MGEKNTPKREPLSFNKKKKKYERKRFTKNGGVSHGACAALDGSVQQITNK